MRLDANGYAKLHEREGLRLKPYLDTEGIPTVAFGNTYYLDGRKVKMSDPELTLQQANELGKVVPDYFANFVDSKLKKPVTQDQFNALVSICYNIGKTGFANSTMLRLININPNDIKIADAIAMWRKNEEVRSRRASELKQYFNYLLANEPTRLYIDKVIKSKLT
jgi:lysozyme